MLICYSSSPLSPSWTPEELRQELHLFLYLWVQTPWTQYLFPAEAQQKEKLSTSLCFTSLRSRCSCSYCLFFSVTFHRAFKVCAMNSASPYKRVCLAHSPHIHSMFLLNSHLSSSSKTWAQNLSKPPHNHCLQEAAEQKQQERGHLCFPVSTPLPRCWPLLVPVGASLPAYCPACMPQNAPKGFAPAWQSSWIPRLVLGNPPECLLMVTIPSIPSSSPGKRNTTRAIWSQARRCHIPRHWHVLHCCPEDSFLNKLLVLRFFFPLLAYL